MKALFAHNFTSGWRNILKYKTQNIISVLCLSVGVLFFAIALYFINSLWQSIGKPVVSADKVKAYGTMKNTGEIVHTNYDMIKTIESLPAVKSVSYYNYHYMQENVYIKNKAGQEVIGGYMTSIVSPDWLKENNFYSVKTGKHVEVLKPGTILIEERAAKRLFPGETPIGYTFTIKINGKDRTIEDIVYSPTYYGSMEDIIVVASEELAQQIGPINIVITLNKGFSKDDLEKQLDKKMPEYKMMLSEAPGSNTYILLLFLLFFALVLLGASVLIIGLAGFLKMQLQLFILRTREMALRRCNGAKPMELFMLLCSELFIIFCFVAVVSMLISWAFEAYSMPMLQQFGLLDMFNLHTEIIYRTELMIIAFAFVVSVVIAWFTVRRNLKASLASNVKTGFTQLTKWNAAMQVTQYVVAIILFFIISWLFYAIYDGVTKKYTLPASPNYYKNIVSVGGMFNDEDGEIEKLPSVGMSAKILSVQYSISQEKDSTHHVVPRREMRAKKYETLNVYDPIIANAAAFKMLKVRFSKDRSYERDSLLDNVPVFVRKEKAASVMKELNISYKVSEEEFLLPDSNKYIQIGYTERFPNAKINYQQTGFYIIEDKDVFQKNQKNQYDDSRHQFDWFILPKNKDVDAFNKDFDALCHKVEDIPADMHFSCPTAYDEWFKELKMMNFIRELLSILAIVSLLSIVLTVFSSISLETRGKQKEVAIRKVNGAKTRDIVMLFSRYYIITLSIAFMIAALIGCIILIITMGRAIFLLKDLYIYILPPFLFSILVITSVTIATVWQKIYKISHINPANLINNG